MTPPAVKSRTENGRNKPPNDDAEHPRLRPRKQKPRVNTALITTNSESDDSDFDTNIVLFTSLPNRGQNDESDCEDDDSDMPPLLDMSDDEEEIVQMNNPPNGRTPTLNPEEVHQTPTRGINVSGDIVSPERGSRGSPPVSTLSRVMGLGDIVSPERGSRGTPPVSTLSGDTISSNQIMLEQQMFSKCSDYY